MLAMTTSRRRVPASPWTWPSRRRARAAGLDGDDERGGDDRRLDEEDRPPVEQLGEHAAERRTDGRADRAGERPPPAGPTLARDDRDEHGQRAGEQQRGADALRARGRRAARRGSSANPATSEAAAKTATPATTSDSGRTRRCSRATGTAVTATTRAYVVSTHDTPTIDVSNSP